MRRGRWALSCLLPDKTTAVMTHVPGLRGALNVCGLRFNLTKFGVLSPGNFGVGVSITFDAGSVQLALITDLQLRRGASSISG